MQSVLRLYRALLHLYPASFREQHGHDLRETFALRTSDLHGVFGLIAAITMAFADIVPNAIAAHAELLGRDVRQAFRAMLRAPVLFGGALLILALGVGANVAVFSMLQSVLLQPLPYHEPERVGALWVRSPVPDGAELSAEERKYMARGILNGKQLLAWREETKGVLADIGGAKIWQDNTASQFDISVGGGSQRLRGAFVTPNFFEVLGAQAALGRLITSRDDREHTSPIVISHALWQREFGGDSSVIGRAITLATGVWTTRASGVFTIVGVLPRTFRFTYPEETEAWAMIPWGDVMSRGGRGIEYRAVARLAPGVSMGVAQARLQQVRTGLFTDTAHFERNETARLEPITEWVVGDTRAPMLLLTGIAALLFIITCTTVANALFVRVAARKRELAVRAALGAAPGRLMRQLVTEGALLAVLGTMAGLIVAVASMPLLRSVVPNGFPRGDEIAVNTSVLAFAAVAAALVVMISAIAPAWRGRRVNLVTMLKRSAGSSFTDRGTARWRTALIGIQTAIATSLLVVAALLTASVWNLGHTPLGFDGENVVTFEMRMLDAKYPNAVAKGAFQTAMMSRIRETPGVLQAGITSAVPFRGIEFYLRFARVGEKKGIIAPQRMVDSAFFSILNIRLVRGRLLNDRDDVSAPPVIVLSELLAKQLFGTSDPIGQVIAGTPQRTVVGVVQDTRFESRDSEAKPAAYVSAREQPSEMMCIVARTRGDVTMSLRKAVASVDADLPVMNITTIDQIVNQSGATRRFYTTATIAFAGLALTLTLAGLMLIINRMIVERRRELAIRSALGATASTLVQHVMQRGMTPVVIGAAVGLLTAFNASSLLSTFLYEITPRNSVVYIAVGALILTAGAIAAFLPAMRATRTRPAEALQAD